jgi:hypothetical protein
VNRRVIFALAAATTGLVAVGAAAVLVLPAGGGEPTPSPRAVDLRRCQLVLETEARDCYTREFLTLVERGDDPRPAVAAITKAARREGGFILANCHVLMHTVGRTYAHDAG